MKTNQWSIGVDLGGTKIEVALVNSYGQPQDRIRIPTESQRGYEDILKRTAKTVHLLCKRNQNLIPSAIGVGVAGQISLHDGIVLNAPNLNWHEVSLEKDLSSILHNHVRVINDVRAATLGEWHYGAGKNCNDLACIFVGTGIGGGIVSGGRILTGSNNTAGEIGHMTLDIYGPECHCGNKGCFEALASGWAIERDARESVGADMKAGKLLLKLAGNEIKNITAKMVAEAAFNYNDALSTKIINHLIEFLVAGSRNVVNAYGPSRLIFGGGIMQGIPQILSRIENGIRKQALKAASEGLKVFPASLQNDSGVIGVATYALQTLDKTLKKAHHDY